MLPGPTALLFLGVGAFVAAVTSGTGWTAPLFILWVGTTVVVARWAFLALPRPDDLFVVWSLPGPLVLGEVSTGCLTLSNQGGRGCWLRASLPSLRGVQFEPRQTSHFLAPGEELELSFVARAVRRGRWPVNALKVIVSGRNRWIERAVRVNCRETVVVHPRVSIGGNVPLPARPINRPQVPRWSRKERFAGLREWRSGEDLRDLAWSATARTGVPIRRLWEGDPGRDVVFALDAGASMTVGVSEHEDRLDWACAVLPRWTRGLSAEGRRVGVLAWDQRARLWWPPEDVVPRRLMEGLVGLLAGPRVWAPDVMAIWLDRTLQGPSDVVLVTEPDGDAASLEEAVRVLSRRHCVYVQMIGDPVLGRLHELPLRTPRCVYRRIVAASLSADRAAIGARLAQLGAVVDFGLDSGPKTYSPTAASTTAVSAADSSGAEGKTAL
jgi:uncharacterized protein (DUF58 family)